MSEKVLDNGLVILAERTTAQGLATVDVKVLAGSSQEGKYLGSGASHLVEHMLFKGTASRKPGQIERDIRALGGSANASVSADLAEYYITVPADAVPQALAILRDMFMNATFDPAEIERERAVIMNELRINKDDPDRELRRTLYATAYLVHPYRHPPIGYPELLEKLTKDDLVDFYRTRYVPNRMVIAIAGDIDPREAIENAQKAFAGFRGPDHGGMADLPREPRQLAGRSYRTASHTTLGYLGIAWHSTELTHADLYALDLLSVILGRGETSRLMRSVMRDKRYVHTVSAWNHTPRDAGLFVITAIADPDRLDDAERAIAREIDSIKTEPIGTAELERAKQITIADHIYARETTAGVADDIATNRILTGSHGFSDRYIEGIAAVTAEDVRRAAERYLTPEGSTAVRIVPGQDDAIPAPEARAVRPERHFTRATLDNGLRVLLYRNPGSRTAALSVAYEGGVMEEDATTNGLSSIVSRMLFKGTATRTEDDLIGAIERMGGSADAFSGISSFGFTVKCLADRLDDCLTIVEDVILDPAFPARELDREKESTLAMIHEEDDDLFRAGFTALKRSLYPDSPYGMRYIGESGTVSSFSTGMLKEFYAARRDPRTMVIAIAGNIDPDALVPALNGRFGRIAVPDRPREAPPQARRSPIPMTSIETSKHEGLLLTGYRTVTLKDPDRYALDIASSVLSGHSGRLFEQLRNKRPLAYALGSAQKLSLSAGFFVFYVASAAADMPEADRILEAEIAAIREHPASAAEIADARREIMTSYRIDLQSNEYIAANGALEELSGRGGDALFAYEAALMAVTPADLQRVARTYFAPGRAAKATLIPR